MNSLIRYAILPLAALCLLATPAAYAQTPVDDDGNPIGEIVLLSATELEDLVGPVALYPDDLLAIVLPASTYPLEIVQAARFLELKEEDPALQADDDWDDAVVALLNYPEVLRMMNDDIDWTWRLGEAVVAQQADVVAAVESFRDRAYAAGNLKSDERQTVRRTDDDVIEIAPAEEDVIYVPYYEPQEVVVRQPRRVYYYYPRAYPVYYYPYPAGHHFYGGYFWGVTTAFRIGWLSDHLHVHHHSYHGHPYYGWNYYGHYWRRPSITVFNTYYANWGHHNHHYRQRYGHYWRPRHYGGARPGHYQARSRYYTNERRSSSEDGYARRERGERQYEQRRQHGQGFVGGQRREPAAGRNLVGDGRDARRNPGERRDVRSDVRSRDGDTPIRFRTRENAVDRRAGQRPVQAGERERRQPGPGVDRRRAQAGGSAPPRPADNSDRRRTDATPRPTERRQVTRPSQRADVSRERTLPARSAPPVSGREQRGAPSRRSSAPAPSRPEQRAAPSHRSNAPAGAARRDSAPPQRRASGNNRQRNVGSQGGRESSSRRGGDRRSRDRDRR